MRSFLVAGAFIIAATAGASADPKQDAMEVVERWAKAFNESDVDGDSRALRPRCALPRDAKQGSRGGAVRGPQIFRECAPD
jgi:hypothetical protein